MTFALKPPVITGLGFISSIGNDQPTVLESLRTGRNGIEVFPQFAKNNVPIACAGTIKEYDLSTPDYWDWKIPKRFAIAEKRLWTMNHNAVYGYGALKQAIEDAQLTDDLVSHPLTGLVAGSGGNGLVVYEGTRVHVQEGFDMLDPYWVPRSMCSSMVANLATVFKIKGANRAETSACATSAHCLGVAYDLIRLGRQKIVLVVGAEEMGWWSASPFAAMKALSPELDPQKASRPYDQNRNGFVISGGAGALILEDADHAQARGARTYARFMGWGESSDGLNMVLPDQQGHGAARSMINALKESGLTPDQISYINTHGTSTPFGDEAEIMAIKKVFGETIPPLSSTKSITGHPIGAAGALEAAFCSLAIHKGFYPASMHIEELAPEFEGLPIVTTPGTSGDLPFVMSNSFGFGGTNVALILAQPE